MTEYKWIYELTPQEERLYPRDKILVSYDRLSREFRTLSGVILDQYLQPIKEAEDKN